MSFRLIETALVLAVEIGGTRMVAAEWPTRTHTVLVEGQPVAWVTSFSIITMRPKTSSGSSLKSPRGAGAL